MRFLENYDTFKTQFNPNDLVYMFDVTEPLFNRTFQRFSEIRPVFYKEDLSKLENFSVIINVHSDGCLGTYIVHNDWVENPFMKSDDFGVCFTIKDYNKAKKVKKLTKNKENIKCLKTKWFIVTYDNKPIALISEYDSWRIPKQMGINEVEEQKYNKFRVNSLKEGLDYLKI